MRFPEIVVCVTVASILAGGCSGARGLANSKQNSDETTRIEIRLPGKALWDRDDNLLRTITDETQIERIRLFADNQKTKSGWRPEWDGVVFAPRPLLSLHFSSKRGYESTFGIDKGFVSIDTLDSPYRFRSITREEWKEALKLISLTEEEFENLNKRLVEPGLWKQ